MLEEGQLALLPEPQAGCATITTPTLSSESTEHFSKPTSTWSLVAEQKGINWAAAPSAGAGQREGIFPKVTASLLCPKHMGKLCLPVVSTHGPVPSCKLTVLTYQEAASRGFIECAPCQTPCFYDICVPSGQLGSASLPCKIGSCPGKLMQLIWQVIFRISSHNAR